MFSYLKKNNGFRLLLLSALMTVSIAVQAAPVLQVGAPAGSGDTGFYADVQANTTDPTETDTAITGGTTILFAGITDGLLKLGGQFSGTQGTGANYSTVGNGNNANPDRSIFDNQGGAIVFVTVAQGLGQSVFNNLTLNSVNAFAWQDAAEQLFPNSHAPVKDATSDFVFFNIGNFSGTTAIPDFQDESLGNKTGEIKEVTLGGILNTFEWLHFDIIALATDIQGQTTLRTTLDNNPGSHDVTFKNPDFNPPNPDPEPIPEPPMVWLLGASLLMLTGWLRKHKS
ncbi:MAG: PEP-CTERM sorting domain-containing protein [Gammaproteobacteria bacterium HGW-Gammaproteobacteria-3]|jgi:hypothetical protein|nr:MAG: PEP-CTERM sorting domain-containing protein [Gammaproteobacteria bacterium HGW-Gammaproteobacteria-3]